MLAALLPLIPGVEPGASGGRWRRPPCSTVPRPAVPPALPPQPHTLPSPAALCLLSITSCPALPPTLLRPTDDRLLIETDCPYLTPRTIGGPSKARPQRNEPALLPHVLHLVAAARGESPERTAAVTTANALRLFRLPLKL